MIKLKLIGAAILIFCFFSCTSNDKKKEETPVIMPVHTATASSSADTAKTIVNRSMIWTVEPGEKTEKLKGPENAQLDTFSTVQLINLLNQTFPDIRLDLVKISNDTIYVKIPESKRLTNEIGNTGAENYLASTTFTLTEVKNIKYVNIAMNPGDHAEPGVYSRDDFKILR